MNIHNRRSVCEAADRSLRQAGEDPKKLLFIYLGIVTGLSLICSGLSVVLSNRIADTGGLSNLRLRSVLSTGQTILPLIQMLAALGLEMGYATVMLQVSRDQKVTRDTLFSGFRHFFPLLWATLLQYLLYVGVAFMCVYLSCYIFLMLPASQPFYELVMPMVESASVLSGTIELDEATIMAAYDTMTPMLLIFLGLYLLVFVPMHYNYRMVIYRLIDQPHPRALMALHESRVMMRRNRLALFKLDLHFWWFYALQLLIVAVCYGDLLLSLCGITLPFSGTASYFVFLCLSLAVQFAGYYFTMNRVSVTYATAYEALLPRQEQKPEETSAPPVPWKNQY